MRDVGVEARGKPALWFSKQRWTTLSRPRLRQRPRRGRTQGKRARFTPLDGTLPSLDGLADNEAFLSTLRLGRVETIHTLETSIEDVFVRVTGRSLK
jgi:hypothetical protein